MQKVLRHFDIIVDEINAIYFKKDELIKGDKENII